jgi:hypothetical protein
MKTSQIFQFLWTSNIAQPFLGNGSSPANMQFLGPFLKHTLENSGETFWQTISAASPTPLADWRIRNVTPLLYGLVRRQGCQGSLPPRLIEELRIDYARSLKTASLHDRELQELLEVLTNRGVEVILLKGADLRRRLYADPALRPMVDVDFFISPAVVDKARQVLGQMGYAVNSPGEESATRLKESFGNELLFWPPPGKILLVDLHWEIEAVARLYRFPYKDALISAQPIDFEGVPVKILSPEHLLINLCLHLVSHWPMGPENQVPMTLQIIDLMWAIRGLSPDWPLFLHEVERFRCSLPVYVVFQGISAFAPNLIPTEMITTLGESKASLHEAVVLSLWHCLGRTYHRFSWLEDYLPRFSPLRRLWLNNYDKNVH